MSEANAKQVEPKSDAKIASKAASDTTTDTRATLSTAVQDMMKEAVSGSKSPSSESTSPNGTVGEAISNAVKNGSDRSPSESGSIAGKTAEKMIQNAGKVAEGISNGEINKHTEKSGALENMMKGGVNLSDIANFKNNVTDQDRKEAKEALEKGISGLVPEADRKLQVAMQNAIVDGDMDKFKEAVKAVGNDPEKLAKMVKEVNDQLNRNENFGGVELSMDSKGNVLLYGEKGNTAVSVNPKTGDTTLRAVERQADGSVVLKDGEIINRTPAEVMKKLGDEATRSITDFPFHKIQPLEKPPFHKFPDNTFPGRDPHRSPGWPQPGGGGGGGGGGEKPRWNDKPSLKDLQNELRNGSGQHLDFTPLKGLDDKKSNE